MTARKSTQAQICALNNTIFLNGSGEVSGTGRVVATGGVAN